MFNVIIFGPPGSGKGTQSANIVKKYQLKHISTGDLLRSEIANGTKLGLQAKKVMDEGKLVSDDIIMGMIDSVFINNPDVKGFLFDGFPRTTAQAESLDDLLHRQKSSVKVVLAMNVGEEELMKRLIHRGKTSGRSDDVNPQIIKARIKEYHDKTEVVLSHYKKENKVVPIEGEGTKEDIFEKINTALDKH